MDTNTKQDVDLSNEAIRNQFIKNYQNITSKVDGKEPLPLSDVSKGNNVVLPDNKPTEVTTGVLGQNVESTLAGAKSQPKDDGKKEVETLMSNYLKGTSETPEEVTSANEEAIARKTEAVKIQNELTAMEKAYRDEIKDIEKNSIGALQSGVQDRINRATDRYNDNRANVSIAYNSAVGAYNSAVETAELKATTYKNRLDSMYKAWEMKKEAVYDLATPEEKAQLDLMTYEKKSEIDAKADAKSKVLQTMLKNGAPASAYSLVDEASNRPDATAESIYASAGRWGQEDTIGLSDTTQAIINNPSLFDDLTPTEKGKVITQLQNSGYDTSNLGLKGLTDTAIANVAQTQKALEDLDLLKTTIKDNLQYIGPISGLQALNPWSKARQVQADVDRVKQTVGKALEGGVLRKEDEEKYKKILATLTDTPETAIYKLDALTSSLQRDVENYKTLQGASGKSLDVRASLQKKGQETKVEDLRTKYNY